LLVVIPYCPCFYALWDANSIRYSAKAHEIAKRLREDRCFPLTELRKDAAHRYSPAAVVAVSRETFSAILIDLGPFAASKSRSAPTPKRRVVGGSSGSGHTRLTVLALSNHRTSGAEFPFEEHEETHALRQRRRANCRDAID
jgi:hypothetical protein